MSAFLTYEEIQERQNFQTPRIEAGFPGRQAILIGTHVVVYRQTDLLLFVRTLRATCGFPSRLHGSKKQSNKKGYDGNHHQQLHQGKGLT